MPKGAINAGIYKDGKLFAQKTNITRGKKAEFQFKPTIWIAASSEIEEGQILNSAILSSINTEISLLGIASADIIMTGGDSESKAEPYNFNLANVKFA